MVLFLKLLSSFWQLLFMKFHVHIFQASLDLLVCSNMFWFIYVSIHFLVMSQLNALYCFEYLWLTKSYRTSQRVLRIENHWPYYTGFGAILTIATTYCDDFLTNGFIFAGLFPFFIVSSYMANPPTDKPIRQKLPIFDFPKIVTEKIFGSLVGGRLLAALRFSLECFMKFGNHQS